RHDQLHGGTSFPMGAIPVRERPLLSLAAARRLPASTRTLPDGLAKNRSGHTARGLPLRARRTHVAAARRRAGRSRSDRIELYKVIFVNQARHRRARSTIKCSAWGRTP